MKVKTLIIALLLSFTTFSQDLIEYNDGKFLRNEKELSIEQVENFMEEYRVGWEAKANYKKGVRFNKRASDQGRLSRNLMGLGVGAVGIFVGGSAVGLGGLIENPIFGGDGDPELARLFYLTGGVISVASLVSSSKISSSEHWINKRDKAFGQLTNQLNSSIRQGGTKQIND